MKQFSLLLAAMLFLSSGAYAFERQNTYDAAFADVPETEWYAPSVKSVYEYGFMNGVSASAFSPDGEFTVAECITVASRLHKSYVGDTSAFAETGGEWYAPYVAYAKSTGIISQNAFDSFDRPATRAETAGIFCASLPDEALAAINPVDVIPDVTAATPYASGIFTLYKAGIIGGTDAIGSYEPSASVKRCEIAAILCRIADPDTRLRFDRSTKSARILIDDMGLAGGYGIQSGWTYDNRYQVLNITGHDASSLVPSSLGPVSMYRLIEPMRNETFTYDALFQIIGTDKPDGGKFFFENENGVPVFGLSITDGSFFFDNGGTAKALNVPANAGIHTVLITGDLAKKNVHLWLDAKDCGTFAVDGYTSVERLVWRLEKQAAGVLSPLTIKLTAGYAVDDRFLNTDSVGTFAPHAYETNGTVKVEKILSERGYDIFSVHMTGADASAVRGFDALSGTLTAEANVLLPDAAENAYVALLADGNEVCRVTVHDSAFVFGDGRRAFTANVWQDVHFDADTVSGKVTLKINGKTVGTQSVAADTIDGVKFGCTGSAGMWFDDVRVYATRESVDYPASPEPVNNDGYTVGLNVCNLWHNGFNGEGWAAVSPFDELTPYLGYYDDGLPEVADWEIKWMVEHGIDFQHYCWYAGTTSYVAPLKLSNQYQTAIDRGFLYAKYSDAMKFCIMWENGSNNTSYQLADDPMTVFKTVIWPYWKDHYFSDSRYMSLDNKALLTIYQIGSFLNFFGGSAERAAACVEFMREDIKTLGYDGLVLWFCDGGSLQSSRMDNMVAVGADALFAYNYGTSGESESFQLSRLNQGMAQDKLYFVPGVSVGFNAIGRHDTRTGLIDLDGYENVLTYARDVYLPKYDDGSWRANTVLLSTWNEYTEGTYIAPTNTYGFGYLDKVRKVFSGRDEAHEDEMPSEAALERVRNIYPKHVDPIRFYRTNPVDNNTVITGTPVLTYDFSKEEDRAKWRNFFGMKEYHTTDTTIGGTSSQGDFAVRLVSPISLNVAETGVDTLHIRMKTSVTSACEFFFITDFDATWDGKKYLTVKQTVADEFADYYIDLTANDNWRGVVTDLRIDPMQVVGSFEIEKIEFMRGEALEDPYSVTVDGTKLTFDFDPVPVDGDLLVTANPRQGFFSMLHAYYHYSRYDNTLLVASPAHEVLFRIGTSTAEIDGVPTDTGFTLAMNDGLPVFPICKLASLLGYETDYNGGKVLVTAAGEELSSLIEGRIAGRWEFNTNADNEGWSFQQATGVVAGGVFNVSPTGRDPSVIMRGIDYDTDKFGGIEVRMKYKCPDAGDQRAQIFFLTSHVASFSEAASVRVPLTVFDTGDDFVTLTFDMTANELWRGHLTTIRFDFFNTSEDGKGSCEIDYIHLVPNAEAAPSSAPEQTPQAGNGEKPADAPEIDDSEPAFLQNATVVGGYEYDKDDEGGERSFQWATGSVTDGFLVLKPTGRDPSVIYKGLDLDTAGISKIVARYRYQCPAAADQRAQMFFVTEGGSLSENASVKVPLTVFDTGDKFVTVVFDMASNELWKGKVKQLRFDFFNTNAEGFGDCAIDYIRFIQ